MSASQQSKVKREGICVCNWGGFEGGKCRAMTDALAATNEKFNVFLARSAKYEIKNTTKKDLEEEMDTTKIDKLPRFLDKKRHVCAIILKHLGLKGKECTKYVQKDY